MESEEFPATSAVLQAAAFGIEASCRQLNDAYIECKRRQGDPSECIEAGELIHQCVGTL